ncbi:MAG: CoB--CoM heterodisulfide reductase iron-sulfur subunit B family protein [Euryarchaeota archaeon]|nr:CoB--CoM heterodisulfide reductase iron-sulfur subunit B family protein [Euryarchaeota archaeon]
MYSLFLGCLIPRLFPFIELTSRVVLADLKVEYEDLEGASCCPAPIFKKQFGEETYLALAARNLCLAKNKKMLTLCNGCYWTLKNASLALSDYKKMNQINKLLSVAGMRYNEKVEVKHFLHLVLDNLDKIKKKIKKPLGLNLAVHHGCHIFDKETITKIENPSNPRFLDYITEVLGCNSIQYSLKNACCGGELMGIADEEGLLLARDKLNEIKERADCLLISDCPSCFMRYDLEQRRIETVFKEKYDIPILTLSELLYYSFGHKLPSTKYHHVNIEPLINKIQEASG